PLQNKGSDLEVDNLALEGVTPELAPSDFISQNYETLATLMQEEQKRGQVKACKPDSTLIQNTKHLYCATERKGAKGIVVDLRVSSSSSDSSDNEDEETGHWKSRNGYCNQEDEDMSRPWHRQKVDVFTRRISDFSEDKRRRMPANVKTYDGTGDPDDHLKIFESAATIENWPQPVWCHMFNSTSPSPYNGIIGRPGISAIRAVPSTAHGMLKFLVDDGIVTIYNTTVPPRECNTVACDTTQTQTQYATKKINLKVAIHPDYPEQEVSIGGRCLTEAGRRYLDLLEERRERAAICEAKTKSKMKGYYDAKVRGVSFRPGDFVYRANDASHTEDARKLRPKWEGPYEVTEALGNGAYKLRDMDGRESPSPYNGIIGRPGISAIRAVPSMAHGILKFHVDSGIVTIYNTTVPPRECNTVACDATQTQTQHAAKVINLKVAIHPDYPEQEVSIGGRCLTEAGQRCAHSCRGASIFLHGNQNLDLLEERRERAAICEAKAKSKMKGYYDAKVRGVSFRPEDFVYCANGASHAEDAGKLGPK
nr:reverse transcriptase domain-containing protein [Tanacetum cinerariifolium]